MKSEMHLGRQLERHRIKGEGVERALEYTTMMLKIGRPSTKKTSECGNWDGGVDRNSRAASSASKWISNDLGWNDSGVALGGRYSSWTDDSCKESGDSFW